MPTMKTPGVYIVEKSAFPNSVVAAPTAVPVFIGHTEKAENGTVSLRNVPFRITSMLEYETYFGKGPTLKYTIVDLSSLKKKEVELQQKIKDDARIDELKKKTDKNADEEKELKELSEKYPKIKEEIEALQKEVDELVKFQNTKFTINNTDYALKAPSTLYTLYYQIVLFFANGGGTCYILSIGSYQETFNVKKFTDSYPILEKEQEPTMVVIPEAVNVSVTDCQSIQQQALMHCGGVMKNRVAILDVFNGFKKQNDPEGDVIRAFRESIGNYLDFAAAYYPWIRTSVVSENNITSENVENKEVWFNLLTNDTNWQTNPSLANKIYKSMLKIASNTIDDQESITDKESAKTKALIKYAKLDPITCELVQKNHTDNTELVKDEEFKEAGKECLLFTPEITPEKFKTYITPLCETLLPNSPVGKLFVKEIGKKINLLPPSAAMAGIYSRIDNSRGVWKAPANVNISMANEPAVNITDQIQEDLNIDINGKSINAIRYFKGEGVKAWGARTMDGNSQDWRYINVRRTLIFLEESIKNAARAYVFEPNVAATWLNMKSMIESFLLGVWKQGGLAGSSPEDAYSVHVGLGDTMTPEEILEGVLCITVLVAITRPAEFIEITFQQQMQKS